MVNLLKLSSLLAYNAESIAYKPIPNAANTLALDGFPSFRRNVTSQMHMQCLSKIQTEDQRIKALGVDDPCYVAPYDAPPILDQDFLPYNEAIAKIYRYRQQQGVNLGSWFVHEKWMTSSLFNCAAGNQASEIDIASGWASTDNARAVFERHWDTFITKADFQYLASIGINTVRLPIGYWTLGPAFMQGTAYERVAPVYRNSWPRVVRAINQAGEVGIGVLVDLHGAVGSQNGQQHSGVSDGQTNLFNNPWNMDKTISVLTFLTQTLATVNNVVGIEVLNEPVYDPSLEAFYSRAIEAMRSAHPLAKNFPIYVHDGFESDRFSSFIAERKDFVVQDHHSYFVFTPSDSDESASQHTQDVKNAIAPDLERTSNLLARNLIIGEWSCALTPQSLAVEPDAYQASKKFCMTQMDVYANTTAGWSFWSYTKDYCDGDPGWCFKQAVGSNLPSSFNGKSKPKSKMRDTTANDRTNSHRFEAIRSRRSPAGSTTQPADPSYSKGYTDGMTAAKQFAVSQSKLGFIGQYIKDAIVAAGPLIVGPQMEESYRQGFMQGLAENEQ